MSLKNQIEKQANEISEKIKDSESLCDNDFKNLFLISLIKESLPGKEE